VKAAIDLDDDPLAEAMRLSGARSKKETVNIALREYAARHRRIAALDHHAAAAQTWDYEGWQDMHAAGKVPAARCAIWSTRRHYGGCYAILTCGRAGPT
jgi:Arc/MetJ family transcription regulator